VDNYAECLLRSRNGVREEKDVRFDVLGRRVGVYGHEIIDAQVMCVITRIGLRSIWAMPWMWRAFIRVKRDALRIPELKRVAFLLEGPRSFFILSVWSDEAGLVTFGTQVSLHLAAVRQAFASASRHQGRPEVWSTQWSIHAASNNTQWNASDNWSSLLRRPSATPNSAADVGG